MDQNLHLQIKIQNKKKNKRKENKVENHHQAADIDKMKIQ